MMQKLNQLCSCRTDLDVERTAQCKYLVRWSWVEWVSAKMVLSKAQRVSSQYELEFVAFNFIDKRPDLSPSFT